MNTTTTPTYGTQAQNAPQGQVNVFDPESGKPLAGAGAFNPNNGVAITPTPATAAIPADGLNTGEKPLKLPETAPLANGGLDGAITSFLTTQKQNAVDQKTLDAEKASKDSSLTDLLKGTLDLGNISSNVDRTAEDTAKKNVDKYTSMLEQEQLSNRRNIEALQKNPSGFFGGGLTQEINRRNTESLSKQADIAILQSAANRDYSTASDIADRQVQNETEAAKAKVETLKTIYDDNKDTFTKDEQRQFDAQIKSSDRQYQDLLDTRTGIANIKLEAAKAGASPQTLAAIGSAKTVDEAVQKAGTSLRDTSIQKLDDGTVVVIDKMGNVLNSIGGSSSGAALPTTVVRTVDTATGTKPVSGYTLNAGDDPYNVAQQYGTSVDGLKALNPSITDWYNIPAGTVLNVPNKDESWLNNKTPAQIQAYNSIPDDEKAGIKDLVNGDILMADYVKSRGKTTKAQIDAVLTQAHSIDPNFSVNQNKIAYNTNQKWNDPNGKSFLTRTAINTALDHATNLYDTAQQLGNTKIPAYNAIANWTSKNAGKPELTNYVYDLTVLAQEIATAYKGSSATDQETEKVYNSFSGSSSPEQFKGVINQALRTMGGKLGSLSQEYKESTGNYPTDPIIHDEIVTQAKKLGLDISSIDAILKKQGYDVPDAPDTSTSTGTINNFLYGGQSAVNSNLDKLWNQ